MGEKKPAGRRGRRLGGMRRKVQVIQADGARFAAAGGEVAADSVAGAIDVPGRKPGKESTYHPTVAGRAGVEGLIIRFPLTGRRAL